MLFHIKLWMNRLSRALKKMPPGRVLTGIALFAAFIVILLTSLIRPNPNPLDSKEIAAIRDRGVLRVGVRGDAPGFGLCGENAWSGLEVEVANMICAKIFSEPDKIEFVRVNSRTATQVLANYEADIVLALKTPRETKYAATAPYYIDAFATMVRERTYSAYEDLNGASIGVLQEPGATAPEEPPSFLAMEELAKNRGLTFAYRIYASYPELKEALEMGKVEAIVFPSAYLSMYYDASKVMISEAISLEPYCALTRKEDVNLLEIADSVIKDMAASGALDALYSKYSLPVFGKAG